MPSLNGEKDFCINFFPVQPSTKPNPDQTPSGGNVQKGSIQIKSLVPDVVYIFGVKKAHKVCCKANQCRVSKGISGNFR